MLFNYALVCADAPTSIKGGSTEKKVLQAFRALLLKMLAQKNKETPLYVLNLLTNTLIQ